jgi:hypothetical protein
LENLTKFEEIIFCSFDDHNFSRNFLNEYFHVGYQTHHKEHKTSNFIKIFYQEERFLIQQHSDYYQDFQNEKIRYLSKFFAIYLSNSNDYFIMF